MHTNIQPPSRLPVKRGFFLPGYFSWCGFHLEAHSIEIKNKAICMRKDGVSVPSIAKKLRIARSTASVWVRGVEKPTQFKRPKRIGMIPIRIVVGERNKPKNRIKNGGYILVLADKDFPGKKFRGKYTHEHKHVWWKATGNIPPKGYVLHHINHDSHDNRIENLCMVTISEHSRYHLAVNRGLVAHGSLNRSEGSSHIS